MIYQEITIVDSLRGELKQVRRSNDDGSFTVFLEDPANTDYQAYLKWVSEGNTPLPADE